MSHESVISRGGGLAAVLVAVAALVSCGRPAQPVLQPAEWDFGTIAATSAVQQEVRAVNPGRRPAQVRFISTCTCLTVEPNHLELAAGGSASVLLRYDPSQDEGEVDMRLIVRSGEKKAAARLPLRVHGRVLPGQPATNDAAEAVLQPAQQKPQFFFEYFYDPGCQGCELFLVRQMITLQQELGIRLRVARNDIAKPEVHEEYLHRLEELGVEERAYPAVVFGDVVLQGDEEIQREFKQVLQGQLRSVREESRQ